MIVLCFGLQGYRLLVRKEAALGLWFRCFAGMSLSMIHTFSLWAFVWKRSIRRGVNTCEFLV